MKNLSINLHAALIFTVSVFAPLPCFAGSGNVVITMLDDGSNAAPYGRVDIQVNGGESTAAICPQNTTLGVTGQVVCKIPYSSIGLASGQKAQAFVRAAASYTYIPAQYGGGICNWTFVSFSGLCQGLGTIDRGPGGYECKFTVPSSGDINIGAIFHGESNQASCPAIASTQPTPTPATPTPTSGGSPQSLSGVSKTLSAAIIDSAASSSDNFKTWLLAAPSFDVALNSKLKITSVAVQVSVAGTTATKHSKGIFLRAVRSLAVVQSVHSVNGKSKVKIKLSASKAGKAFLKSLATVRSASLTVTSTNASNKKSAVKKAFLSSSF